MHKYNLLHNDKQEFTEVTDAKATDLQDAPSLLGLDDYTPPTTPSFGHTKADVELQILNWLRQQKMNKSTMTMKPTS